MKNKLLTGINHPLINIGDLSKADCSLTSCATVYWSELEQQQQPLRRSKLFGVECGLTYALRGETSTGKSSLSTHLWKISPHKAIPVSAVTSYRQSWICLFLSLGLIFICIFTVLNMAYRKTTGQLDCTYNTHTAFVPCFLCPFLCHLFSLASTMLYT